MYFYTDSDSILSKMNETYPYSHYTAPSLEKNPRNLVKWNEGLLYIFVDLGPHHPVSRSEIVVPEIRLSVGTRLGNPLVQYS